jgi:hypothetical protein
MNTLALRLLTLPQLVLILLTIGLMVVGAILAARQDRTDNRLLRAPYFAIASLTGLALSAAQVIWFLTGPAAAGGWLWVLLLIYTATFILGGYLLFPAARARSRDAWGHPDMAFLTFIPVANLWLLLKQSQGEPQPPHGLSGATGVIVGLVAGGATAFVNAALPEAVQRAAIRYQMANPISDDDRARMALDAMGLEATLADLAATAGTPRTIDSATVLQRIDARGTALVFTYTVTLDLDSIPAQIGDQLHAMNCDVTGLKHLIDAGATIEHAYLRVDGSVIGTVNVDSASCAR